MLQSRQSADTANGRHRLIRSAACPRAARVWSRAGRIRADQRGSVLVEAALVMPVLIMMLLGLVTYGSWFMAAHSLQEVANDAARASVAGLNAEERQSLVDTTVAKSVLYDGTLDPAALGVKTARDENFYRVTLTYDLSSSHMFADTLVPLPGKTIVREAAVQLVTP